MAYALMRAVMSFAMSFILEGGAQCRSRRPGIAAGVLTQAFEPMKQRFDAGGRASVPRIGGFPAREFDLRGGALVGIVGGQPGNPVRCLRDWIAAVEARTHPACDAAAALVLRASSSPSSDRAQCASACTRYL